LSQGVNTKKVEILKFLIKKKIDSSFS